MSDDLSLEQLNVLQKVQKLMNLAAKAGTKEEGEAAAAKAQELLTLHNLKFASVEKAGDGKREQVKTDGGFYAFQRHLWHNVAKLNFCLYWTQTYQKESVRYVDIYTGAKSMKKSDTNKREKVVGFGYRHALVGRILNTRATINMCDYLQKAIERVTEETIHGKDNLTSNYAYSFRYGCAMAVVEKVQDQREEYLKEERDRQRAAAKAASGASDGTSLSLSVYIDKETDANNDFIHGEGWSAERAKERQEEAAEAKREQEAYAKWAKANPEEAKAQAEEREAEQKKYRSRSRYRGGSSTDNIDYGAFYAGKKAGASISIHQQAKDNSSKAAGRLSGPKAMHL